MKTLLFFILCISVAPINAQSLFSPFVNNAFSGGQLCGAVDREDYLEFINSKNLEDYRPEILGKKMKGNESFQRLIYLKSVDQLEKKTTCMKDYSDEVLKSEEAIDEVLNTMIIVWLNKKKAELILKQCTQMRADIAQLQSNKVGQTWSSSSAADAKNEEYSYLERNGKFNLKYYETCSNGETLAALYGLISLSDKALPVLSSKELLNVLEKNREIVILKSTGKPLRDEELIDLDLSAKKTLSKDKKLVLIVKEKIKDYIISKIEESEDKFHEYSDAKFTSTKMKELYSLGITEEAMTELGLSNEKVKGNANLSRMYTCFKNNYEESAIGGMMDFIFFFTITKKAIGNTKLFSSLPALVSDGVAALAASTPQLVNKCILKKKQSSRISASSWKHNVRFHKTDLPTGMDIDLYTLGAVSLNSIPSCTDTKYDAMYLEKSHEMSCVQEVLLSTLPPKMSFGYMAVILFAD